MSKRFFIAIFFISNIMHAQDPIFTQYYLVPEFLNPAFTGISNSWSAGSVHRRQWPNGNTKMDTQYAYVNNLISDEIGIGINVMNQTEVFSQYNYFKFNGVFAYIVDLNYEWRLRLGAEVGFGRKDFGFSNLLLEDQINPNTGEINNGGSVDPEFFGDYNKLNFLDYTAGFAFDHENTWLGLAVRHLNRPDIAFREFSNVPLNMFLTVHGGHFFELRNSPFSLIPSGSHLIVTSNYMRQSQYNRLDLGVVFDTDRISFGMMFATNPERRSSNSHILTSINPIVSFKFGEFIAGYSHDFNTTSLTRTQGIHEFSLVWQSSRKCGKCYGFVSKIKKGGSTLRTW